MTGIFQSHYNFMGPHSYIRCITDWNIMWHMTIWMHTHPSLDLTPTVFSSVRIVCGVMLQCKTLINYNRFLENFYEFRVELLRIVNSLARKNSNYKEVAGSTAVVEHNLIKFQCCILMPKFLIVFFSWQICTPQYNSSSRTAAWLYWAQSKQRHMLLSVVLTA